jgi:catechol 2,3-dioxygenase-like lactoylglutathione lyase family enzyme
VQINGIAHVVITAGDFERARAFYAQLLPFLGMKIVSDSPDFFYGVGGRTAFGIEPPPPAERGKRFVQGTVGLHHVCFRVKARADVDEAHAFLQKIGAHIVHAPDDGHWAPGYYSVLFEDPDGTRLEINHVPGQGLLAPDTEFGGLHADGDKPGGD